METSALVEQKELSSNEKKALFEALERAQNEETHAAKTHETAHDKVRACLAAIATKLGKGSYIWKGKTYQLVKSRGSDNLTLRQAKSKATEIG